MNDSAESEIAPTRSFDFERYLFLAKRFLWLLLILPVVGAIGGWFYGQRLPDIYESRATMLVESQERKYVDVEDFQTETVGDQNILNTIVESMRSRTLLEDVAKLPEISRLQQFSNLQPEVFATQLRASSRISIRRNTRLIDITVENRDPVVARDLCMGLYETFISQTIAQRTQAAMLANKYLVDEEARMRSKLEASEQKLQAYKENRDTAALSDRQNIIVNQLNQINSDATTAKNERMRIESDLEALNKIGAGDIAKVLEVASVAELPQVVAARGQLSQAKADFEVLKQRYLPKHPKFIAAQSQIAEFSRALQETSRQAASILAQKLDSAKSREQRLDTSLKEQERKALELDRISIPYNVIVREVDSDRALYQAVVERLKMSGVSQNLTPPPFRLIDSPLVAGSPVKPDRKKLVVNGFILGLLIAIGLIVVSQIIDNSYSNLDDVERDLETGVLAAVFQVPKEIIKSCGGILFSDNIDSRYTEAFRTLRASLSLLGDESQRKTFLITSAVPGEGKSFTSLNLALSFAKQGLKTILIDADLRRPTIHKYLQNGDKKKVLAGLSEYLSGHIAFEKIIVRPPNSSLDVVPAGGRSPTPAELLDSPALQKLIDTLRMSYDRIIVDSPPVNAVSDALVLAPRCQVTCLVVRAGKTPKKAVRRAVALLRKSGAKFAGVILNCLRRDGGASYYYYYYGSEYEDSGQPSSAQSRIS